MVYLYMKRHEISKTNQNLRWIQFVYIKMRWNVNGLPTIDCISCQRIAGNCHGCYSALLKVLNVNVDVSLLSLAVFPKNLLV